MHIVLCQHMGTLVVIALCYSGQFFRSNSTMCLIQKGDLSYMWLPCNLPCSLLLEDPVEWHFRSGVFLAPGRRGLGEFSVSPSSWRGSATKKRIHNSGCDGGKCYVSGNADVTTGQRSHGLWIGRGGELKILIETYSLSGSASGVQVTLGIQQAGRAEQFWHTRKSSSEGTHDSN